MTEALRHPLDPDPTVSTKASAVLALGIVAAVTGPFVGGLVPGTIALILAQAARTDMIEARGYLTGVPRLRLGVRLAWLGIILAIAAIVVASIVGLIKNAAPPTPRFDPGTD
jgi:(hydroxyamino)benzene mutase